MRNKNPKPKQKYNWPQIKLDFFASNLNDVATYFRHTYNTYNKHISRQTAGWREEKIKWKNKAVQEALDSLQTKEAKKYEAMTNNIMAGVAMQIDDKIKLKKLHPKAMKIFWDMTRTMEGKPTRITREHLHHDTPLIVDYSSAAADRLKKYADAED